MAVLHSDYAVNLIEKLTKEEKIALVSGHDFMYTNPVPRWNIPSIRMSDGPHGLRVQTPGEGNIMGSESATCFPTAATSANSWNPVLTEEMGQAMGEEARFYGIDVILGPGVCLKRNPLCGRNFEYFSEDPLLAGRMGGKEVEGIQSQGVAACVKHFALNNEENHRFMGDSVVDMRAARELYLKPFEYIVKNAHPETVMNAYNKINGVYCTENAWLLTDVLRTEWGFHGLVMTDWGATHDRVEGIKAGNDLEMPGDTKICRKWIADALQEGKLDIQNLDECVLNVLDLVGRHQKKEKRETVDWKKHHEIAGKIAEESAVLLKNNGVFPLSPEHKLCIIGEFFEKMRYQGAGSSMINPYFLSTCKEVFDSRKIAYSYCKGYRANETDPSQALIQEAVNAAKEFDRVLLFLGTTDLQESEGGDREDMKLPKNQLALVDALLAEKKSIAVVLFGGSVVELPFFDSIDGLLNMFLPGQNGGEATYNILFGKVNPSGKLAETWPLRYEDVPYANEFGTKKQIVYKESVYVGYRYYLSANQAVRFPFGYGLSYSEFEYSDLKVQESETEIRVLVKVRNVGEINGKEIVQVYVGGPRSSFYKPLRELKGFTKVAVKAHETVQAEIRIPKDSLHYWNTAENQFCFEKGDYLIEVGKNSQDIVLKQSIHLEGQNLDSVYPSEALRLYLDADFTRIDEAAFAKMSGLPLPRGEESKSFTLESRFTELRRNFLGKILFNAVIGVAEKDRKKAEKLPEGSERDNRIKAAMALRKMLESNSLLTMSMSAGASFPYNFAEAFCDWGNGRFLKGISDFTRSIKAPKLPIEEEKKNGK